MEVEIISSEVMKGTRRQPWPKAAVPLTIFDKVFLENCSQTPMVYVARSPCPLFSPSNKAWPRPSTTSPMHLAGRLAVHGRSSHRRRSIALNNAGIRVVEASVDAEVGELLQACPSSRMAVLHPQTNEVQFNHFKCGWMAMGGISTNLKPSL